jgi:hypothetical protein
MGRGTTKETLVAEITDFYLKSREFNGLPLREVRMKEDRLKAVLRELIDDGKVSLVFGDVHPNPHVKAFEAEPTEKQLEKMERFTLADACAYPTPAHLARVIDRNQHRDAPFTLELYLGEPQLKPYFFDLAVLETYRNDPRYYYRVDDIGGRISVRYEHAVPEAGTMRETDQVFLQRFGFGYDEEMNRAVAVFLWDLHVLSPEHQRLWHARMLAGTWKLHPDYYRTQILGQWGEGVSILSAFIEELHQINEMARLMGRPSLFREEYREEKRPKTFTFLIRPALKEFNDFVHLLDKMISENINLDFFRGDVSPEEDVERPDGRIVPERKGSLRVLEEWVTRQFKPHDPTPMTEMFATFKKIRKLRQKPAHSVEEDKFDQTYVKSQRDLIMKAYNAMRTLRLILANHPNVRGHSVPDWLQTGKIWTY